MGWSVPKAITAGRDSDAMWNPANYRDVNATWFQKGWWSTNRWGWIYTNDTNVSVKLTKATFKACAGHSNGRYYCGAPGTGATLITYGYGCRFEVDVRVIDSAGNRLKHGRGVSVCTVESIDSYNCVNKQTGQIGAVSSSYGQTSFGDPAYGWGGNKQWHDIPFYIDKKISPAIPPGGRLIVTVNPVEWFTSSNNALLVLLGDSSNFAPELEPEDEDYIYVCLKKDGDTEKKWYREKKAYLRTNVGWEQLKEI